MVHGRLRHPASQGRAERCSQDVENMLNCWMADNQSIKWSLGCYFVEYQKNCSYHRIINWSPYHAVFWHDLKIGLSSTTIPSHISQRIHTAEEYEQLVESNISDFHKSLKTNGIVQSNTSPATSEITSSENSENTSPKPSENTSLGTSKLYCISCQEETSCIKCNSPVHLLCGEQEDSSHEGYGSKVLCFYCKSEDKFSSEQLLFLELIVDLSMQKKF